MLTIFWTRINDYHDFEKLSNHPPFIRMNCLKDQTWNEAVKTCQEKLTELYGAHGASQYRTIPNEGNRLIDTFLSAMMDINT